MDELSSYSIPELFYDLIAILIPGAALLGIVYVYFPSEAQVLFERYPASKNLIALAIVSYIMGHAVYSLSTTFVAGLYGFLSGTPSQTLLGTPLAMRKKRFNKYFLREDIAHDHYFESNIKKGVEAYTGRNDLSFTRPQDVDIAYEFCRNFIMEKAPRNYLTIRKEQAYGELCRGMLLILATFLLLGFFLSLTHSGGPDIWAKQAFVFVLLIAFAFRYGQARHTVPIFVFSAFCTFILLRRPESK